MGQYYMPFLSYGNKKKYYKFYSFDYDNGLKLTEHSWIGNNFMNAISSFLLNNPMYVAWIGDYAEDSPNYLGLVKNSDQFEMYKRKVWDNNDSCKKFEISEKRLPFGHWFLVNHTQKIYIDLTSYIYFNSFDGGWCYHPLSLLTACGNGLGGGDYRGCNLKDIGSWAFNKISINYIPPEGYREVCYDFNNKEGGK